jgi:AraC family L-rhamnose operon transcriptional activator RhaR
MKDFKPLYLQNLSINMPGLKILRLQLNRHLRELDAIAPHKHEFDQLLVYFAGRGIQIVEDRQIFVRTGTVVFLRQGCAHAFRETAGRRPLCLAIDFIFDTKHEQPNGAGQLTQTQMLRIRQQLSELMISAKSDPAANQLNVAGLILQILDVTLKGAAVLSPAKANLESPLLKRVRYAVIEPANSELRLEQIAVKIGYQLDHLNRLLRRQSGLTLGQIRNQELTIRAKRLLRQNGSIGEVAATLGFNDQNYFSRWFRAHAGTTPSVWRKNN